MRNYGYVEFQLMLLRRMADYQPGLVADTLRRMGWTRARQRTAHDRWQALLRSRAFPAGVDGRRWVLGEPLASLPRPLGAVTTTAYQWLLPLWPELRFEVLVGPGDVVYQEWLVRAGVSPVPQFETVGELVPWSAVVGDVVASFPGARHVDGTAPSRWAVDFTASDHTDTGHFRAVFVWGLLQTVDCVPDAIPQAGC